MATAVQLELRVDEKGAIQGIRAFDTNIKGTTSSVKQLNAELSQVGTRARAANAKAPLEDTSRAAKEAKERLHLVTEEAGIHMPRAFRNLAAQSKVVQTALGGISASLIAIGGIQIGALVFEQLYEGAKKLWDEHLSLTKAASDYFDEVEKTRQQDFGNSHSIETTRARIDEATESIRKFHEEAANAQKQTIGSRSLLDLVAPGAGSFWQFAHNRGVGHEAEQKAFELQRQADKLNQVAESSQFHEQRVRDIEIMHAADAQLRGIQKINAEKQKSIDLNAEDRRFNNERDRILGNAVPADAGAAEESAKNRIAQRQADADLFNLRRDQALELAHMREQALEAGLTGSALYHAQEAAAIEDLKSKDMDSIAARNAIHLKFHNEEMKRLADQQAATEKLQKQAALTGATGIAKIQGEGDIEIGDIRRDKELPEEEKAKRIAAVRLRTGIEVQQAEEDFARRTQELADQNAQHQVSGFARIRVAADREIAAARQDFEKLYQTPELQAAHAGELNKRVGLINAGAGFDASELSRRNADETLQIEMEARSKLLSAERQQTAAIEIEYEQRLEKFKQQLDQQEISENDYNRRVQAAAQQRDAEMEEAAKQAREKMASEFSRFFSNPTEALKEFGNKAAGEAAAALVQRMQGRFGGGQVWDEHLGIPTGFFGHFTGASRDRAAEAHKSAASGMFSVATAQIHVGTAVIAGGTAAGSFAPAGSTSLLGGGLIGSGSSSSGDAASTPSAAGNISTGSTIAGGVNSVFSGTHQGMSLFSQAKGIFGSGKSSGDTAEVQNLDLSGAFDKNGNFNLGGGAGKAAGGLDRLAGGVGGAVGLYSAIQGDGGFGGALSGAMSGMQLGMSIGGPIGAAIGAAGGAIIGALGFGGREKARVYDLKTVRPRIQTDILSYQQGTMDYLSAYSDLETLDGEARKTLRAMGGFGGRYYWSTVNGEIRQAEAKLSSEERAGRSRYHQSAAQFDVGADMLRETGWAVVHKKERIVPSDQNERITRALEAGASAESIARGYRAAMSANSARPWQASAGDRTVNMNFHTLDSKTAARMFMENKHHVRAALNASYAENSGGADA